MLLFALGNLGAARAATSPPVLILISRNPTDAWAVAELDGMQEILRSARPAVAAEVEYMDVQAHPVAASEVELVGYLRTKYSADHFQLILAADAPALDFVVRHRDELWPQAQAVFCGVTKTEYAGRAELPWLTGVIENTDPAGSIRLALRLQPHLHRFVILEDSQNSGRGAVRRITEEMPELQNRVSLDLLRADTARALFRGVENLQPGTAVLLTRAQVARRMGPELLARCPVPIYGQRSPTHLGAILGGSMIDGERHGQTAAQLGLRLLAGQTAGKIPLVIDVPPRVVADYAQMQRFGLPLSALPPETEILNRPRRVWEEYPTASSLALLALISLTLLAGGLAFALRQNRRNAGALKTSLSLLNATLDASADGVLVVDLKGHVSSWNRRFVEFWGMPPELIASREDARMLAFGSGQLKDPEGFLRRVEELMATPEAESQDLVEFRDGRVFERRTVPQRLDGIIVGRVWNFADITARRSAEDSHRRLQAELAHTHRLESLGTLAGGIAHDFNNLLTAILGYTQLAHESLAADDPVRTDLAAVLSASERARDLVQQILTFSRKGPSERRSVRLAAVVRDAVRLLRATVPAAVDIQFESDAPQSRVLADSSQIHQAILNLGTNAAHAMRSRAGTISVRLEEITVTASLAAEHPTLAGERCVCLSVRDTGDGMNEKTLRRAFDPFFTTKSPGEGTGLGLAVVHGIMESHGGAVTIESSPGAGTTVRLYLLLGGEDAPLTEEPAFVPALVAGFRVLVVDDEQAVLGVAEQVLHRAGCEVIACSGPMPALAKLEAAERGFDVLVTDLNMPQMSGIDLAAEARRLDPEMAIVLATGFLGEDTIEQRVVEIGIEEIVTKPYHAEGLLTAIRRAHEKARIRAGSALAESA